MTEPTSIVFDRYRASLELLARAEAVIPLGSQTFSKSRTALPVGTSPLFAERGQGSRLWDVDGNEYVDFVNGLLAISLGYRDPDVDAAVEEQLRSGTLLSLPHRLETEVAELIVELVPCAELVRFGKNGSDATSGAIPSPARTPNATGSPSAATTAGRTGTSDRRPAISASRARRRP